MNELSFAEKALKEFNHFISVDLRLSETLIRGRYDFLQLYQPLIFLDLRNMYRRKHGLGVAAQKRKRAHERFRVVCIGGCVLLVSVLSVGWLWLSRKKVLLFSSDKVSSRYAGDFRIQGIYEYLNVHKTPFFECFHTVLGGSWFRQIIRRHRPALYIEASDVVYGCLRAFGVCGVTSYVVEGVSKKGTGTESLSIDEIHELASLCVQRIPKTLFRIKVLTWVVRLSSIRVLLTIDSVRRYGELVAACRAVGVKVYAFQHGQFTKYQVGWLKAVTESGNIIRPTALFVWTDYWKSELERLGTYFLPDELRVGGNPRGDTVPAASITLPAENKNNPESFCILMLYESDTPQPEVLQFIEKILVYPGVTLYFKTRPDLDRNIQLGRYGISSSDTRVIVSDNINAVRINAVVGTQSTFLYEAVQLLLPVHILRTGLDYAEGMVTRGLAEWISGTDASLAELTRTKVIHEELLRRRSILVGQNVVQISDTLSRIIC